MASGDRHPIRVIRVEFLFTIRAMAAITAIPQMQKGSTLSVPL
jgi:hypothetical protein